MTEEQIKNLKPGDKFTLDFYVYKKPDSGHFLIQYSNGDSFGVPTFTWEGFAHAKLVTPPPTFEVGDTVRIVPDPLTGTVHGAGDVFVGVEGKTATVAHQVEEDGEVDVLVDGGEFFINVHCLELVKKAVKDKYAVRYCYVGGSLTRCNVVQIIDQEIVSSFSCSLHPDAIAAARDECARLNAESRKQEGGAE